MVGASERLQGCSAGPQRPKLCVGVRTGHLRHEGAPSPRRPALQLPLPGRSKFDHAALPPPGNPPTSRGAHSRLAASSRGPRAWVHVQCTCSARAVTNRAGRCERAKGCAQAGRELCGRASRLNPFSSSEKPRRPTRCSRQRVARASLPIVPGRPNAVE